DKKLVDLNAIVAEAIEAVAPPGNVEVRVENALPSYLCEPTRVRQVFQNLLGNSVKFIDKPHGLVRVGYEAQNGHLKFYVSDNGPGIDSRHFEKFFQLFQTLAPRDKVEGTGIGLTIAKKIVEMYGGRIWVESEVG